MKTVNVRELRNAISGLKETLAKEHEILLVSNGVPIARILPVTQRPALQPLDWLRRMGPRGETDSAALIRAERSRRGS